MAEENNSTSPLPFEEFVRQQFELLFVRLDNLESKMVERFLQLSRQIKHLDQKVDISFRSRFI